MQPFSYIGDLYRQAGNLLFDEEYESPWAVREITRQNWIPKKTVTSCMNPSCQATFSAVLRRHNCRSCGQVFCRACVQYFLRLNKLAQPDPDGERYKVCQSCHDRNSLDEVDGQSELLGRSYTAYFRCQRNKFKDKTLLKNVPGSDPKDVLRWLLERLDLDKECHRLLNGFQSAVGKSKFMGTLNELKNVVSTPKWLKPELWNMAKVAECCHLCKKVFDAQLQRSYCRVCGIHICKSPECSTKDLLLYVPDKDKKDRVPRKPRLAIIRIVGCPGVQPHISLHLRLCPSCKNQLTERQLKEYEEENDVINDRKFMDVMKTLNEKLHEGEDLVKEQLPAFRETVDSLEDGEFAVTQENLKDLAEIQADLAAVLARHLTMVDQLKKLKPQPGTQASLQKHYVKAKCDFYFNNISVFRAVKRRMEECMPTESLEAIQMMMVEDPLKGAHLYIQQLEIETTALCKKYDIDEDVPKRLRSLGAAILCDVQEYFQDKTQEKSAYFDSVLAMAETRARDNCLISPSQSLLNKKGSRHVHGIMYARVEYILTEVKNQLHLVSDEKKFHLTKEALTTALEQLKEHMAQERSFDQEFVFVDNEFDMTDSGEGLATSAHTEALDNKVDSGSDPQQHKETLDLDTSKEDSTQGGRTNSNNESQQKRRSSGLTENENDVVDGCAVHSGADMEQSQDRSSKAVQESVMVENEVSAQS